jgi:hypothetical protein
MPLPNGARRAFGLLQRENGSRARMKKQHPPVKNRFFRFYSPSFSFSIRSASECSFSLVGSINF